MPRSKATVAKMSKANLGKEASRKTRAKMRESLKRRYERGEEPKPTWSSKDDELVRTLPVKEAAQRTGRSERAVYMRPCRLGVNTGRTDRHRE